LDSVLTEDGALGPSGGRGEKTAIAHRDLADDTDGDIEQIGDARVLDPRFGALTC